MKMEEFYKTEEITYYCKNCLSNECNSDVYRELWEKAKDIEEFKKLVREDKRVRLLYGTNEPLGDDWHYLRSILGDKQFKIKSDLSGVKVGNESFSIIIPNGLKDGDKETRVAVLNLSENNPKAFEFLTSIQGKFNIYADDFGYDVAKTMEGRYGIYYNKGFVVFEKWNY